MPRLSFALTIAALVGAIVVLSAFALHALFVSGSANDKVSEPTGKIAQATVTTEETTTYKEETTALEETTVLTEEGDLPRPPDSTLSYGGQEVIGTLGSYCWMSGSSSVCADSIWPLIPSKQKTLTVPSDSEMVFRYGGQSPPKTVEVAAYQLKKLQETSTYRPDYSPKAQGSGVQRSIPAELPPEEYVLEVSVKEQQGDAAYYFRVIVE
jgi:hypothetical protein